VRVLLDECVPRKLKHEMPGHDVQTVSEMGWSGIKNGPLLRRAAEEFDAFITVDQGFQHQRNLSPQNFVIVVMVARSNDIGDLRPLLPQVLKALETASPGGITRVQI